MHLQRLLIGARTLPLPLMVAVVLAACGGRVDDDMPAEGGQASGLIAQAQAQPQPNPDRPSRSPMPPMPPLPPLPPLPEGWTFQRDAALGFGIAQPPGFVTRAGTANADPALLASLFVMNPTMAAGALAGAEPPDLQIRVYRAPAGQPLKAWIEARKLGPAEARQVNGVAGFQVCAQTLAAPGCSTYLQGDGRIYQLTPISYEGEAMVNTFALLR